ncbi:MAG: DUF4239 domain-containing protein [Roseiarcus sp.]
MSLFLSGLPLWAQMLLLVVLPTAVAMCGPVLLRRWLGYERLSVNNEVAGFKFATIGVIYSVLVAFAVIVVWEKFNDAETAVVHEAAAAATLDRLAAGPEPASAAARAALADYLNVTIEQEWPALAKGERSSEATKALEALYAATLRLSADGARSPAIVGEMLKQLDAVTQARRARLHLAAGVVPGIVWLVLICGAALTVGFTFFFGAENLHAQVLMTGVLSVLAFMALMVIVSIDHPFTGPSSVEDEPLRSVLEDFAR